MQKIKQFLDEADARESYSDLKHLTKDEYIYYLRVKS